MFALGMATRTSPRSNPFLFRPFSPPPAAVFGWELLRAVRAAAEHLARQDASARDAPALSKGVNLMY